jgi:uncharacterized protein (TIGR03663 family)
MGVRIPLDRPRDGKTTEAVVDGATRRFERLERLATRRMLAIALGVALVSGVILRIAFLGERPMHHDESIHATLSFQWWDTPDKSTYRYDPTYHGPFLYTILHWIYPLFGVGVTQARLFPLFFGLLLMLSPLLFRRYLGRAGAWTAVGLLAVSPVMTYYSRFLAHDMPAAFFAVAALAALLAFRTAHLSGESNRERSFLVLFAMATGIAFSVKATTFLYLFVFGTFAFFAWAVDRFPKPAVVETMQKDVEARKRWMRVGFLAAGVFCFSYGLFQTSLFHRGYEGAFVEGLFTRVFSYWWGQHSIERVQGPVTYHARSMFLHELPMTLAILGVLTTRLFRERYGRIALGALGVIFLVTVPFAWKIAETIPAVEGVFGLLKMKASPDIFLYAAAFVFGILGAYQYYAERRKFMAFLVYWTFATLAIYSYVGEKVPWLTVHVALPACFLSAVYAVHGWRKFVANRTMPQFRWRRTAAMALLAVVALWQCRIAYLTTFVTAGTPNDLFSQVHNTKDVKFVMDWIERVSYETGERPEGISFAVVGAPVWAFYFHFIERGFKRFALDTKSLDGTQRFVVLDEPAKKEKGDWLEQNGYKVAKFIHSGWWVPEHGKMTWGGWLSYAVTHRPPTTTGTTFMWVYHKPN